MISWNIKINHICRWQVFWLKIKLYLFLKFFNVLDAISYYYRSFMYVKVDDFEYRILILQIKYLYKLISIQFLGIEFDHQCSISFPTPAPKFQHNCLHQTFPPRDILTYSEPQSTDNYIRGYKALIQTGIIRIFRITNRRTRKVIISRIRDKLKPLGLDGWGYSWCWSG